MFHKNQFQNSLLREKVSQLPLQPGVYLYKDATGTVIYVGKARNLRARVRSYFNEDRLAEAKTGTLISEATLWNEGNGEAWLRWGEAEEKRGSVKAARSAYEKYLALAPDAKNAAEVKKRLEKLK